MKETLDEQSRAELVKYRILKSDTVEIMTILSIATRK